MGLENDDLITRLEKNETNRKKAKYNKTHFHIASLTLNPTSTSQRSMC